MRTVVKFMSLMLLSGMASLPVHAHHSFAMFDEGKCQSVTGSVKKFQWAYPHMWLWLVVEGADGAPVNWGFEGGDPASLAVGGWSQSSIKKGEKVTVFFNPLRDGRQGGSLRQVILPSGDKLAAQVGSGEDDKYFKACIPSE